MAPSWEMTAWPQKGDGNPDLIYTAVGKALTSWEFVEQAMAQLFAFIVSSSAELDLLAPSIRSYGAVASSLSRCEMLREGGEAWFHRRAGCPFEDDFWSLLNEFRNLAARRNEIAHGKVDSLADEFPDGWYLFPGVFYTKKRPLGESAGYRFIASNIDHYAKVFENLHNALVEYRGALIEWNKHATAQWLKEQLSSDKRE